MKKYQTIVVDPPWRIKRGPPLNGYKVVNGKQVWANSGLPTQDLPYPTMTIGEIKDLVIPADKNCHLYLWVVNAYIENAYQIIRHWGFKPSTLITWVKNPRSGLGGCYKSATEWVIFARKGKLSAKTTINKNWFNWKRLYDKRGKPKHSAKPKEFFDMVENISPSPYLEMFARNTRKGWSVWGNEVKSDIELFAGNSS